MKAQLNTILNKEMDRKDFLRHVGVAVMMFAGGGAIMQAIGSLQTGGRTPAPASRPASYGYGSTPYGGR